MMFCKGFISFLLPFFLNPRAAALIPRPTKDAQMIPLLFLLLPNISKMFCLPAIWKRTEIQLFNYKHFLYREWESKFITFHHLIFTFECMIMLAIIDNEKILQSVCFLTRRYKLLKKYMQLFLRKIFSTSSRFIYYYAYYRGNKGTTDNVSRIMMSYPNT